MTARTPVLGLLTCLVLWGCGAPQNLYESHLQRELAFFQAGVDVEQETARVVAALRDAGLRVVEEVRGPGFVAIGAANHRFERTVVRIITQRGVSAAEEADRGDILHPGRVHLLSGLSPQLDTITVIGWVRIDGSASAGCARLRRIDAGGYVRPLHADVSIFGDAACLAGWMRRSGRLWGSVAWPELSAYETPVLEVPLELEKRPLDDPRPPDRLELRAEEGWIEAAREARLEELSERVGFWERHAPALELAALGLLQGESADAQRAAYLQQVGAPQGPGERALLGETTARIERGWLSAEAATAARAAASEPVSEDVLQEPVHGQEAQKEELTR